MSKRAGWLVALALTLAACGGSIVDQIAGGAVGNNGWTLEGTSPDGKHLLVSTLFGGVASDCTRFEGWTVVETDEVVEITASLWQRRNPDACTAEGVIEQLQVNLDQPLGDRTLTGCGTDECLSSSDQEFYQYGRLAAGVDTVGVFTRWGVDSYRASGEALQQVLTDEFSHVLGTHGPTAIVASQSGDVVAVDLESGQERWRASGWPGAVEGDTVYVCRGMDSDGLTSLDAATGAVRWETGLPCDPLVSHGERLTVVANDPQVDGGNRLVVIDAANGKPLVDQPFFDGTDDQVEAFDHAVAAGDTTLVSGIQANLVILSADGEELYRQARGLGAPTAVIGDIAVLVAHDRTVGYNVTDRAEQWTLDVDGFRTIIIDGQSLWHLERNAGTVSRLDPLTGTVMWTTPIGITSGFDVTTDGDVAYVLTTQALIAMDKNNGAMLWFTHRPHPESDGIDGDLAEADG